MYTKYMQPITSDCLSPGLGGFRFTCWYMSSNTRRSAPLFIY